MPLPRALILVVLATTFFSATSLAKEFTVGDDHGWTIHFDYQAWASDKVFHVGDKLIFKYPAGKHNVFKVNGTDFRNCTVPPASQGLTSGDDVIVLESPGRKWYLCGVAAHCENGQKLFINVLPSQTQAPSPSPVSSVLPITVPPSPSPSPQSSSLSSASSSPLSAKYRWLPRKLIALFQH
ncbi:blue copper protein 1a-like [Prosopis cineraria]|uniref:blue copper protein 1a-like n=1 Tax=Prosopis cineraria TaxID=364024 RepID=UPI00240F4415|nr:blue copper protein 1a-like [Prosopis cineraria]